MNSIRVFVKAISLFIAIMIFCSVIIAMPVTAENERRDPALADNVQEDETEDSISGDSPDQDEYGYKRDNTYDVYLNDHKGVVRPDEEVVINAYSYDKTVSGGNISLQQYMGVEDALVIGADGGSVTWELNVPKESLYFMDIAYYPIPGSGSEIELGIKINEKTPFKDASRMVLNRIWKDSTSIRKDSLGNDIRPLQEENPVWIQGHLEDNEGLYGDPFAFCFNQGRNTITLEVRKGDIAIDYIKLYNPGRLPSYEEIQKDYQSKGYKESTGVVVKKQSEEALFKSHPTLYPMYDRSSAATEPSHPTKMRYNTTGQWNWQYDGQWISWEFTVPEDGCYEIGFKARQNFKRGFYTNRRVYIDGEVLFKELDGIQFPFDNDWYIQMLGGSKPYSIYLSKGRHEIKLEAVPGDMAETVRKLEDVIYKLNYLYRKMIMITGTSPDQYRDYQLHKVFPDLLGNFEEISETLKAEKTRLEALNGKKGSEAVVLEQLYVLLDSMIEKPYTIPKRLGLQSMGSQSAKSEDSVYKSYVSGLSSWLVSGRAQPLELDYLIVKSSDTEVPSAQAGFFSEVWYNIKSILGSFVTDYNSLGDVKEKKDALDVWVALGRDQAQLIKEYVDSYFVPEFGIPVNIKLVQGSILEATLAGRGPDIALYVGGDLPVNLASRGAVIDLKQFPDYEDVIKRFLPQSLVPFQYLNGSYALPLTQDFPVLFYRKDVLSDLGIDWQPDTWEDFYRMLPYIQRNYMEVGLGDTMQAIQPTGSGNNYGFSLFTTLILQQGENYFNKDLFSTTFQKEGPVEAFTKWTDFYRQYGFPLTYDFFNRFRTGEMPLAIAPYSMYNMLSVAAPELRGLWGILPVPGTVRKDGSIDHATNSIMSAAIIFNCVKNNGDAWRFIEWFTREDIQARYGRSLEALMGSAGRLTPATYKTLGMLPWSREDAAVLEKQWQHVKEIPSIPASYVITRNINNAYRKVVLEDNNPRTTLYWYNRDINEEIERKWREFGVVNGKGE